MKSYFGHKKLYTNFEKIIFLEKTTFKFRNLQINKILKTDPNRISPIPFKVMYISARHT